MEPTDALRSIETALRLVIRDVLGADGWVQAKGAPDVAKLEERQNEERRRRDGVVISDDLLNFTETYHLITLIERNWDQFKPVFDNKARTTTYFDLIADFRNSIAHSRELVPFERELLSGIAGQLRNQVALFRSAADQSAKYYPLIEEVKDSFGAIGLKLQPMYQSFTVNRIDVGHVLGFVGSAFNARGNTVRWLLRGRGKPYGSWEEMDAPVASGDDVIFEYVVTEEDVSESFELTIEIRTDSKYRRSSGIRGGIDDSRTFRYSVNPPDDEF